MTKLVKAHVSTMLLTAGLLGYVCIFAAALTQAAKSNRSGLRLGSPARGLIDQREWDAPANRSRSLAAVSAV